MLYLTGEPCPHLGERVACPHEPPALTPGKTTIGSGPRHRVPGVGDREPHPIDGIRIRPNGYRSSAVDVQSPSGLGHL